MRQQEMGQDQDRENAQAAHEQNISEEQERDQEFLDDSLPDEKEFDTRMTDMDKTKNVPEINNELAIKSLEQQLKKCNTQLEGLNTKVGFVVITGKSYEPLFAIAMDDPTPNLKRLGLEIVQEARIKLRLRVREIENNLNKLNGIN